jgi:hypothetical protein
MIHNIKSIVILGLLLTLGCTPNERSDLKRKIEGRWIGKRYLTTENEIKKINGDSEYLFNRNGTYEFNSVDSDVVAHLSGNYLIVDSIETQLRPLLILIQPSFVDSDGDTVRAFFENFEILNLTDNRLTLRREPMMLEDSAKYQWYSRTDYFEREK